MSGLLSPYKIKGLLVIQRLLFILLAVKIEGIRHVRQHRIEEKKTKHHHHHGTSDHSKWWRHHGHPGKDCIGEGPCSDKNPDAHFGHDYDETTAKTVFLKDRVLDYPTDKDRATTSISRQARTPAISIPSDVTVVSSGDNTNNSANSNEAGGGEQGPRQDEEHQLQAGAGLQVQRTALQFQPQLQGQGQELQAQVGGEVKQPYPSKRRQEQPPDCENDGDCFYGYQCLPSHYSSYFSGIENAFKPIFGTDPDIPLQCRRPLNYCDGVEFLCPAGMGCRLDDHRCHPVPGYCMAMDPIRKEPTGNLVEWKALATQDESHSYVYALPEQKCPLGDQKCSDGNKCYNAVELDHAPAAVQTQNPTFVAKIVEGVEGPDEQVVNEEVDKDEGTSSTNMNNSNVIYYITEAVIDCRSHADCAVNQHLNGATLCKTSRETASWTSTNGKGTASECIRPPNSCGGPMGIPCGTGSECIVSDDGYSGPSIHAAAPGTNPVGSSPSNFPTGGNAPMNTPLKRRSSRSSIFLQIGKRRKRRHFQSRHGKHLRHFESMQHKKHSKTGDGKHSESSHGKSPQPGLNSESGKQPLVATSDKASQNPYSIFNKQQPQRKHGCSGSSRKPGGYGSFTQATIDETKAKQKESSCCGGADEEKYSLGPKSLDHLVKSQIKDKDNDAKIDGPKGLDDKAHDAEPNHNKENAGIENNPEGPPMPLLAMEESDDKVMNEDSPSHEKPDTAPIPTAVPTAAPTPAAKLNVVREFPKQKVVHPMVAAAIPYGQCQKITNYCHANSDCNKPTATDAFGPNSSFVSIGTTPAVGRFRCDLNSNRCVERPHYCVADGDCGDFRGHATSCNEKMNMCFTLDGYCNRDMPCADPTIDVCLQNQCVRMWKHLIADIAKFSIGGGSAEGNGKPGRKGFRPFRFLEIFGSFGTVLSPTFFKRSLRHPSLFGTFLKGMRLSSFIGFTVFLLMLVRMCIYFRNQYFEKKGHVRRMQRMSGAPGMNSALRPGDGSGMNPIMGGLGSAPNGPPFRSTLLHGQPGPGFWSRQQRDPFPQQILPSASIQHTDPSVVSSITQSQPIDSSLNSHSSFTGSSFTEHTISNSASLHAGPIQSSPKENLQKTLSQNEPSGYPTSNNHQSQRDVLNVHSIEDTIDDKQQKHSQNAIAQSIPRATLVSPSAVPQVSERKIVGPVAPPKELLIGPAQQSDRQRAKPLAFVKPTPGTSPTALTSSSPSLPVPVLETPIITSTVPADRHPVEKHLPAAPPNSAMLSPFRVNPRIALSFPSSSLHNMNGLPANPPEQNIYRNPSNTYGREFRPPWSDNLADSAFAVLCYPLAAVNCGTFNDHIYCSDAIEKENSKRSCSLSYIPHAVKTFARHIGMFSLNVLTMYVQGCQESRLRILREQCRCPFRNAAANVQYPPGHDNSSAVIGDRMCGLSECGLTQCTIADCCTSNPNDVAPFFKIARVQMWLLWFMAFCQLISCNGRCNGGINRRVQNVACLGCCIKRSCCGEEFPHGKAVWKV